MLILCGLDEFQGVRTDWFIQSGVFWGGKLEHGWEGMAREQEKSPTGAGEV